MSSITMGQGVASVAVGLTTGFLSTQLISRGLIWHYGKDAEKNKALITVISQLGGTVIGAIAGLAMTATTAKPLTAVSLPTSSPIEVPPAVTNPSAMTEEGLAVVSEKFNAIMTEMSLLKDQLESHATNGFKYLEELTTDSQNAVYEQVSKLFQETIKQYKETLDLWKLMEQKLDAFFIEYGGIDRSFRSVVGITKAVVSQETKMHESNLKFFNILKTFLDKYTPKSGG